MAKAARKSAARKTPSRKVAVHRCSPVSARRVNLQHPKRAIGKPWPLRSLRAYDLPGQLGWGPLLRKVLRSRGWSVSSPCHSSDHSSEEDEYVVWIKEFEAMLRRQPPQKLFGTRGAVQEGHRLRSLRLPPRALWLQSVCEYRQPVRGSRVVVRDDFARLVAKYGRNLPAEPGHFRNLGFPSMDYALSKNIFSEFFRDAPWYPKTYILPEEKSALLRRLGEAPQEYWITKPRNECAGAGICVWRAGDPMLAQHIRECCGSTKPKSIVQRYVADPHLLGGYKYHMRIHLLITSLSPPQAFVQSIGQCLCSTKLFNLSQAGLGEQFDAPVHISNTGLNTKEEQMPGFLKKKPVIGRGQQILVSQLEAHLARHHPGFSREKLWRQIVAMATDVVRYLAQAPAIWKHGRPAPEQFFDILGLDLIVDRNLKVWMCEANNSPCLSDQDKKYQGVPNPDFNKENQALSKVWHDTLTLLGLDSSRRQPKGSLRGWYELDFQGA